MQKETAAKEQAAGTEKGRILVVDDNRLNRLKLSMSLQQQGHEVSLAEDGQQALDALKAGAFDVVLLDILMPGMDGYEVLEKVKGDPELRDIPVIVISALDEIDSVVRCIEMGAEDYLPKSFNPVLLRARLSSCLQKKKLRDLEKMYLQQEMTLRRNEKLATLGRLSAGVAHELNNPAAAAQRGASQLAKTFASLQQAHLTLSALGLNDGQRKALTAFDKQARQRAQKPPRLDALARSDLESDLDAWLSDLGVDNAWEMVPNLIALGFDKDDLAPALAAFTAEQSPAVVAWLNCCAVFYSLADEIGQGAARISEIVRALKAYTYMDQAPIKDVDLHEGLDSTLVILRSKLRQGVTVERDYAPDLPRIEAYGSELNQVWTNIIDNAIDAMDGAGDIMLRTRANGKWVTVEIEDNGPGIPESLQTKIFDPFFTTKAMGKGSGLGLSICHGIIVQKHKGEITVQSQPGKTVFQIRLPLRHAGGGDGDIG